MKVRNETALYNPEAIAKDFARANKKAQKAQDAAQNAQDSANDAQSSANVANIIAAAAEAMASLTGQHFWLDDIGIAGADPTGSAYVTTTAKEIYCAAPNGRALICTSNGFLLQESETEITVTDEVTEGSLTDYVVESDQFSSAVHYTDGTYDFVYIVAASEEETDGWFLNDSKVDLLEYGTSVYDEQIADGTTLSVTLTLGAIAYTPLGAFTADGTSLYADGNLAATMTALGVTFFADDGKTAVASFSKDGARVGLENESHLNLDYHSLKMTDKEGNDYVYMSDFRNAAGVANITSTFTGDGIKDNFELFPPANTADYDVSVDDESGGEITKSRSRIYFQVPPNPKALITVVYTTESSDCKAFTIGKRKNVANKIGGYSVAEGFNAMASGYCSHSEGFETQAIGWGDHAEGYCATARGGSSHAEGEYSTASGSNSHAEGDHATASGNYGSHAEGRETTASGDYGSHAEGRETTASGDYGSHAEGRSSIASGNAAHAEGYYTEASGGTAHTQNYYTKAQWNYQTAIGKCNDNQSDTAFEIGNGTKQARSNAFTVDWSGNVWAAGTVTENNGTRDIDLNISEATIQAFVDLGMSLN